MAFLEAALSFASGKDTNRRAKKAARENRKWQEYMSNTAHQRQMADMEAAGLNPILSGKFGGASVPSGAVADVVNSGQMALDTYASQMSARAGVANANANTKKQNAETLNVQAQNAVIKEQAGLTRQQAATAKANEGLAKDQSRAASAKAELDESAAARMRAEEEMYKKTPGLRLGEMAGSMGLTGLAAAAAYEANRNRGSTSPGGSKRGTGKGNGGERPPNKVRDYFGG